MMRWLVVAAELCLATPARAAQSFTICQPRETTCPPPATFRFVAAQAPFNAAVRYGGEIKIGGEAYWQWLKDAEPPAPCTTAQRSDRGTYGVACRVPIGGVLYVTQRFRVTEGKR